MKRRKRDFEIFWREGADNCGRFGEFQPDINELRNVRSGAGAQVLYFPRRLRAKSMGQRLVETCGLTTPRASALSRVGKPYTGSVGSIRRSGWRDTNCS